MVVDSITAFLINSQVMLMLLVHRQHFEQQIHAYWGRELSDTPFLSAQPTELQVLRANFKLLSDSSSPSLPFRDFIKFDDEARPQKRLVISLKSQIILFPFHLRKPSSLLWLEKQVYLVPITYNVSAGSTTSKRRILCSELEEVSSSQKKLNAWYNFMDNI